MRILDNQRSVYGSPYVYYTVDVTASNRQLNSIDLSITVSTHMTGTGSLYGQGYVLYGYLYVEGNWYSIPLKGQYEVWRDANVYTYTANYTISGLASTTTSLTNIKFKANETRVGDTAGLLTETACSNITIPAGHQSPTMSYTIAERQSNLISAGVANNVFVENLSQKRFTFTTTTYDGATINRRTVYNRTTAYSSTTNNYVDINFANNVLYKDVDDASKVMINCMVSDTLGGVTYSGVNKYNYIAYIKPSFNATATTTKRNGQTSGLVRLNVSANFYNGTVGNVTNAPVIKYKYWQDGQSEPSDTNYITINSSYYSKSGNTVTISNYEIGSSTTSAANYFDFNKKYNVKIRINDGLNQVATITTNIIKGLAVWSEYKDRVDFMNISMGGIDIFPVGYIFLTTDNSFNPNGKYKGTWEKLSADAYFKIVTSSAGSLGGTSSQHKIPVSSLPSHNHSVPNNATVSSSGNVPTIESWHSGSGEVRSIYTGNTGDGQAYYPYYYGVIAWHRTA